MIENAIRAVLVGAAGLSAVGSKVRPLGVSPLDARPYITVLITDRNEFASLDGGGIGEFDLRRVYFEVGIYADNYTQVATLAEAVNNRLSGFDGSAAGSELDVMYEDETPTDQTPISDGSTILVYVRVMRYKALYRKLPPTP